MTREDAERRASALNAQGLGNHWFAPDGAPAYHRYVDGAGGAGGV